MNLCRTLTDGERSSFNNSVADNTITGGIADGEEIELP